MSSDRADAKTAACSHQTRAMIPAYPRKTRAAPAPQFPANKRPQSRRAPQIAPAPPPFPASRIQRSPDARSAPPAENPDRVPAAKQAPHKIRHRACVAKPRSPASPQYPPHQPPNSKAQTHAPQKFQDVEIGFRKAGRHAQEESPRASATSASTLRKNIESARAIPRRAGSSQPTRTPAAPTKQRKSPQSAPSPDQSIPPAKIRQLLA